MNAFLCFLAVISVAHASHLGAIISGVTHGGALQGPGSHAAVIGPDGSRISAGTAGGGVGVGVGHAGAVVAPAVGIAGIAGPIGIGAGHVGLVGSGIDGQVGIIGSGIEGQYVQSGLEHLYDDGSYRLEHHLEGVHGILSH